MKIAMISSFPVNGAPEVGSAYYARALADELCDDGLEVEAWAKRSAYPHQATKGVMLSSWSPGWFAWLELIRLIGRRRPDIVHLQHSMFLLGAGASGELSTLLFLFMSTWIGRRPLVVTCHDIPMLSQITPEYVRLHRYRIPAFLVRLGLVSLFRSIALNARFIVVLQEAFANVLIKDFGAPKSKLRVVPHLAIPYAIKSRVQARAELGFEPNSSLVLFFGFATGYKGIEKLLDAMALLAISNPSITLILGAGEHPKVSQTLDYQVYYNALRIRAGAQSNIRFVGFIPDDRLDEFIDAADLAVFPYIEFQGMSGPLNQCASHGTPFLVSTKIAASVPGFDASVVVPEPTAIASGIASFFDDPNFAEKVGRECVAFRAKVLSQDFLSLTKDIYAASLRNAS